MDSIKIINFFSGLLMGIALGLLVYTFFLPAAGVFTSTIWSTQSLCLWGALFLQHRKEKIMKDQVTALIRERAKSRLELERSQVN